MRCVVVGKKVVLIVVVIFKLLGVLVHVIKARSRAIIKPRIEAIRAVIFK